MNNGVFPFLTLVQSQQHAMALYPKQAFGLILSNQFQALAVDTLSDAIREARAASAQALIYSHPDGTMFPDAHEMSLQRDAGIPFGVVGGEPLSMEPPMFWGDNLPIAPLIGRNFIHGIWDCYTLVRDTFSLGKDKLAEQGINGWPYGPIKLPEVPRDDCWWDKGQDLYMNWLKPAGFVEIPQEQIRPGDGFLLPIRSKVLNHAGLVLENNQILHHLPTRLSRRENGSMWAYQVEKWVRYTG